MNPLPAIQYTCRLCTRSISPQDVRLFGQWLGSDMAGRFCVDCRLKQRKQLNDLELHINCHDQGHGCDECHRSLDEIEIEQGGRRQLYLHHRDNTLQFLCFRCSNEYVKRANTLYKNTLFGWKAKLK